MIVIGGHAVAAPPPVAILIERRASAARRRPRPFVAALSMLASFLHWGMSLVFSGSVKAMRRTDFTDYRAAGAGYSASGPRHWASSHRLPIAG